MHKIRMMLNLQKWRTDARVAKEIEKKTRSKHVLIEFTVAES